ncbi:MAG TPA: class I SAM-dependent methyltransferase [Gammaproteobacteria bacterium]|nr:class I SAM-dependent methyltransferase [Gammaproteobacteria bacterium]
MSILWERRSGGNCYQVRQAGHSRRLYTNGVFHSQYNPHRPLTGSVWDLLFLPAFFYPAGSIRRVLVLGVGGGAVIRQLHRFVKPAEILGIELNPVHITLARRFFDVKGEGVRLQQADAVDWVRDWRGAPFDMIIDDLFSDQGGEAQRAVAAGPEWAQALLACLAPGGLLVSNFASRLELEVSAYLTLPACRRRIRSAFRLETAQNYNAVGAFLDQAVTTANLRRRLRASRELDPRRKSSRLAYRIRTLWS